MADQRTTSLDPITTPDDSDVAMIVDVSDTSMSVTGTNKKITWLNLKSTLKSFFDTVYATTTQGAKADSAVQPSDLSAVAFSNDYNDLDDLPSIPSSLAGLSGDSDDISEGATNLYMSASEKSKLSGIESNADVTDASNVSSSGGAIYVSHGATAGTTRPSVSGIVIWIGSAEPTNAVNGDVWLDT